MKTLHQTENNQPEVSLVLLDWSCRESFHMLNYLQQQNVARNKYEVIWIEYYDRQAQEIQSACTGPNPAVDQWIVLGMPTDLCFHKHLMYNIGILASRGKIVVICDSDVMVKPTFIESIMNAFKKDQNIVLHLDEVRNSDQRFYPFNSPSFDEIVGEGCLNWTGKTTTGIADQSDTLHTRNYGACMAARRNDLVAIGGADEHIDYLGHICGPYEMTFRLANAGKREIWHESEYLYHTWHPGTDGVDNHMGPHDGRNVSTAALDIRRSNRILPLIENPAIRMLRENNSIHSFVSDLEIAIPTESFPTWAKSNLPFIKDAAKEKYYGAVQNRFSVRGLWVQLQILILILRMVTFQFMKKAQNRSQGEASVKKLTDLIRVTIAFIRRMWLNNWYLVYASRQTLDYLAQSGVNEVVIYGEGPISRILMTLVKETSLKAVRQVKPNHKASLSGFQGKVVLSTIYKKAQDKQILNQLGIISDNIVELH